MKKLLTLILLTACIRFANAQSVGINTTSPDTSAALEIKSNAKGLLIPRLSTTERTNIYSPANGLLVYDSTVNQFYYYNGSAWFGIPNTNYLSANGNDIYNNNSGNVGIGTTSPSEKLQIADANLLNSGTFGSGSSLTISGSGSRMFFYPKKAAFRAGAVPGANWDDNNIGNYSAALGEDVQALGYSAMSLGSGNNASGNYSFAGGRLNTASGVNSTSFGYSNTSSGTNSTSFGYSNTASGFTSFSIGWTTSATGQQSVAMGKSTLSSGNNAFAMGNASTASASNSIAMGNSNTASGDAADALGYYTTASGDHSFAANGNTTAKSYSEAVFGQYNTSYTPVSTTAWNTADRLFSIGNGSASGSTSDALVVLKSGNVGIGISSPTNKLEVSGTTKTTNLQMTSGATSGYVLQSDASGNASWVNPTTLSVSYTETDPKVGTLTSNYIPKWNSTSLTNGLIYDNGTNVGIGTTSPSEKLQIADANLLNSGTFGSGSSLTISGSGSRMFFYPKKAAFRAGAVPGANWDDNNIGNYSAALGEDVQALGNSAMSLGSGNNASGNYSFAGGRLNTASGVNSTSFGYSSTASGFTSFSIGWTTSATGNQSVAMGKSTLSSGTNAFAMGNASTASASNSIAMGNSNTASGDAADALGYYTTASGDHSFAANGNTTAKSYSEAVFGQYNTSYTPVSTTAWNTADRLFSIGNGSASGSTSDALVVLKSGNVGIGISSPTNKLEVSGTTKTTNLQMTSGATNSYVLQSDSSGNGAWVNSLTSVGALRYIGSSFLSNNAGNGGTGTSEGTSSNLKNIYIGSSSGSGSTNGDFNVAIGSFASRYNSTGYYNSSLGAYALSTNTTGYGNTAIGTLSLRLDSTGQYNVAVGSRSLENNANGSNNTAVGYAAGYSNLGSGNVFVGQEVGFYEAGSNKLYIDNSNTTIPLIYGDFSNNHLTINDSLTSKYIQMTNGAISGYVLQSNTSGNGTWVNPTTLANGNWTTSGNNQYSALSGNVGIGVTSPQALLDITGTNAGTNSLLLRSGNANGSTSSNQMLLSYNGTTNYQHAIKSRHNSSSTTGNAIDFYVWDHGTDATTTVGTQQVMTVASNGVGIGTTSPVSALDFNGAIGMKAKTGLAAGTTNPDNTGQIWIYSSGTGTITLPTASTCTNRTVVIINQTGSSRTISPGWKDLVTSSQTSLGSSVALWLVSDGSNWLQIK